MTSFLDKAMKSALEVDREREVKEIDELVGRADKLHRRSLEVAQSVLDHCDLSRWLPDVAWNVLDTNDGGLVALLAPADTDEYADLRIIVYQFHGHRTALLLMPPPVAQDRIPDRWLSMGAKVGSLTELARLWDTLTSRATSGAA